MQRKAIPDEAPRPLMKKKSLIIEHQRFIQLQNRSFEDDYTILKKIGEGSFGSVYKIQHNTLKLKRALKVIRNNTSGPYPTKEQINVLTKLDHPNILKLYQFYEIKDRFFLITELFEGRELFTEIVAENPFTEKKASDIIAEILKGIHYTHTKGITHRDIKAENILIKKDEGKWIVKIIDWGLGTMVMNGQLGRKCGTPEYVAPEVFTGKYNEKCDMWSVGVILYIMLLGQMPFKGSTIQNTIALVTEGQLPLNCKNWNNLSDEAKNLILALIVKNPKERLSADQALRHPWINKFSPIAIESINLGETLNNLKTFHVRNNLSLAALNFINNCLTSDQDRRIFHRQFDFLDKNRNGVLSFQEMVEGYASIYGQAVALKVVQDVFDKLDINQNGSLEYNQFITYALMSDKEIQQSKLKEAFKMFDQNKDGLISCQETKNILRSNLEDINDEELNQVIQQIDENRDGFIDQYEFLKCLKSVSKLFDKETHKSIECLKIKTQDLSSSVAGSDRLQLVGIIDKIEVSNDTQALQDNESKPFLDKPVPTEMIVESTRPSCPEKTEALIVPPKKGRPKNCQRLVHASEPTTRQTRQQAKKTYQ